MDIGAYPDGFIKVELKLENRHSEAVFIDSLGKTIDSGVEFKCLYEGIEVKCKLFKGAGTKPTEILITPQAMIPEDTVMKIIFPEIKTPALDYQEVKIRVQASNLNSATNNYELVSEYIDNIIVTQTHTPT